MEEHILCVKATCSEWQGLMSKAELSMNCEPDITVEYLTENLP